MDDVIYVYGGRGVDGKDLGDLAAFKVTSEFSFSLFCFDFEVWGLHFFGELRGLSLSLRLGVWDLRFEFSEFGPVYLPFLVSLISFFHPSIHESSLNDDHVPSPSPSPPLPSSHQQTSNPFTHAS